MSRCDRCGAVVEFRYVAGRPRPVPIHRCGAAWGDASFEHSAATQPGCFPTRCKHCKAAVFFIRHNGGSVWVDPPLGHPWMKHKCMHPEDVKVGKSLQLVSLPRSHLIHPRALLLAVVTHAKYISSKKSTTLKLDCGEADPWSATVKYDCQFLLRQLVIVDRAARTVVRFDAPHFRNRLLSLMRSSRAGPPRRPS